MGRSTFATQVASGSNYNVRVAAPPGNPTQACSVSGGSGTVGAGDVTNVVVNVQHQHFTVGGSITGLAGSGLVLQNNGGDDLHLDSGGNGFAFPTASAERRAIQRHRCRPTDRPGADSATVDQQYWHRHQRERQQRADQLRHDRVLDRRHGDRSERQRTAAAAQRRPDNLAIAANGQFTFPTSLPNNTPYTVTIATQPCWPDADLRAQQFRRHRQRRRCHERRGELRRLAVATLLGQYLARRAHPALQCAGDSAGFAFACRQLRLRRTTCSAPALRAPCALAVPPATT